MDASISDDQIRSDTSTRNEAFRLLSDETRVEILQAFAEAQDPTKTARLRFTDLRDQISADDPGRINYHLNKLMTHFVRRTEDGYELRESGQRILRVLHSGTAVDNPEIESVQVDIDCWFCGGQTELSYRDGWRILECTTCDARCVDTFPPGVISKNEVPPSGLLNRTPNEIIDANRIWSAHRRESVMDGVCPECAGNMPVESIHICEGHQPDWDNFQFCEGCGSIFWMLVLHICEVCKYSWKLPTLFYPTKHPAVIAFYYEHDIEFDLANYEQRAHLLTYREELLSDEPIQIRTTIPIEGNELRVTFDERMNPIEVSR